MEITPGEWGQETALVAMRSVRLFSQMSQYLPLCHIYGCTIITPINLSVRLLVRFCGLSSNLQVDSMAPGVRSRPSIARKVKREVVLRTGSLVNTRGLPTFPVELLLEILSHISEDSVPIPNKIARPLPPEYLERGTTLRTLSQLCRSLRNVALPTLWEKIEAWATTSEYPPGSLYKRIRWQKDIATDLVAQLETVTIRAPFLASHVRYVIRDILDYHSKTSTE